MDDKPQVPRQGITVIQNTAIRQSGKAETINPYVSRTPAEKVVSVKPKTQEALRGSGGTTVIQETGIRRDSEIESKPINTYVARTPAKPKSLVSNKSKNFSVLHDAKQTVKDGLNAQDSIGSKAIAGYITAGEVGIRTWKIAQASEPAAIGGTKAAVKVVRGN